MRLEDSDRSLTTCEHGQKRKLESDDGSQQSDVSDDTNSEDDVTWYPGDGICPPTSQFNYCCQKKIDIWKNAASTHIKGSDCLFFYIKPFLRLVEHVPPFFHCPPEGVDINGRQKTYLVLKSSLQLNTTDDLRCEHRSKSIDYLQCIGVPKPVYYRDKVETPPDAAITFSAKAIRSDYLTTIVLAWSYIISCRWVEILQRAGKQSRILHDKGSQLEESFWDIIVHSQWIARVQTQRGTYYSPWMLRKERITKKQRNNLTIASPNSLLAFDILLNFCISEGLESELLTGFTAALMLTSRNAPPPKFSPPKMVAKPSTCLAKEHKDTIFHELFESIDKWMFLSSTQDALDSILCSAFFDPCVPCNLIGAASLGMEKALSPGNGIDNQRLLNAITYMKPHMSVLWMAVVCSDQATTFLDMALHRLPPLCLVAGFLTNTIQSFLQITYHLDGLKRYTIPRTEEFQTFFYSQQHAFIPWSPWCPFGATPIHNISLEVREHLTHMHRPISWVINWALNSGERKPASAEHQIEPVSIHSMFSEAAGYVDMSPHPERFMAEEQSYDATYRLFNWHRACDDGIWLDDGQADIQTIRQLQSHSWIFDRLNTLENESLEECEDPEPCVESILHWAEVVETHRRSGDLSIP